MQCILFGHYFHWDRQNCPVGKNVARTVHYTLLLSKKSYINTAIIHKSYWCHQFDGNMYFLCFLHIAMHTMQCTQCTQCTLCTQLAYSRWRCQDIAVSWPLCFPPLHKLHNMYIILGVSVTFNGRKWKHYCSLEDMQDSIWLLQNSTFFIP